MVDGGQAGEFDRVDAATVDDDTWPLRPWIMAVGLGIAGFAFAHLVIMDDDSAGTIPIWRQVAATFVFVTGLVAVLVLQHRRWPWAVCFAIGCGAILSAIGWSSLHYDTQRPDISGWPFLAAAFAVLIASPLFQTVRDEGRWRFPYARLHRHAWTDAVIGAAALAFVGVTSLVTYLLSTLLHLIEIDFVRDALEKGWFNWMLAGTAFGAAAGLMRERDRLLAMLLNVVLVVLSVLAPIFAGGLALFLVALPFTGLEPLWATESATPILLLCAIGAMLFVNAVIGTDTEDAARSRILNGAAIVLSITILPLAVIAAVSMAKRIAQHGWTPERLWGAVAVLVALAYGVAYLWALVRGRRSFAAAVRPFNTRLAIATCALALLLAMPFVDFGAISTRSQVARLESGRVEPDAFDYWVLKEDFGPAGRRALAALRKSPDRAIADAARESAWHNNRWDARNATEARGNRAAVDRNLRLSDGSAPPPALIVAISRNDEMCVDFACVAVPLAVDRYAVVGKSNEQGPVRRTIVDLVRKPDGPWAREDPECCADTTVLSLRPGARVEVRPITRRQIFVDGEPVGESFE